MLLAVYQLVVLVAGTAAGVGLISVNEIPGRNSAAELSFAFISGVGLALIGAGLWQRAPAPERAGTRARILIAIGVVPSIVMFWMIVPPIVALVVAIYSLVNGSTQQRKLAAGT